MANFLGLTGLTTQRQEIINKWADLGLLDGLDVNNTTKINIATLLESQAPQIIYETEETPVPNFYLDLQLPIARRMGARTLFQDIESKKNDLTPYNYVKKHKL
jgi:hypothetical protein